MDETRAKALTLVACILGSAVVFIDQTVVNVALPAVRDDLDASLVDQQWIVAAYLLPLASLILVGGSLGDLHGRRRIFSIGVAGFGVASVLCAMAREVEILIAARALQGMFGALLVPSSLAIITNVFQGQERGAAIGSWTAWTSACIAVGPPLGGLLVDTVGWQAIFVINVPLVAGCLYLINVAVPECPGSGRRRVDLPGAVLCALGLGGPVYALISQPAEGWGSAEVLLPLVGGVALLAAFVAYERSAPDPMLPVGIFASRGFTVGNLVTAAVYAGLTAGTLYVALFLQQIAGYGALEAGLALVPVTLILLALSRRFGALAQLHGPAWFLTGGPVVAGFGLSLYARLDEHADYFADVLPAALVFGLGMAATVAPLTASVLASADRAHAGVASGVNNAIARVAGLVAIAVVGAVISTQFSSQLDERLPLQSTSTQSRDFLEAARERPLVLPDDPVAPGTRIQAREANVDAFQAGMLVAGLVVMVGGMVAFVGLREPPRPRPERAAEAPVSAA